MTSPPLRWRALVVAALLVITSLIGPAGPTQKAYAADLQVNGNVVTTTEAANLRWLASNTFPRLQGTTQQRVEVLATVSWWSLKEGVLDLGNIHSYSNCLINGQNVHISPTAVCSNSVWQVGPAGMQVNNTTVAAAGAQARTLYPGQTVDQVLTQTLATAGFSSGSAETRTVLADQGKLRQSWLVRNAATAFTLQYPFVMQECVNGPGCFSAAWSPSNKYAPTKAASLRAREDLRTIFSGLVTDPGPDPQPVVGSGEVRTPGAYLTVRAAPTSTSTAIGRVEHLQQITFVCQAIGSTVTNPDPNPDWVSNLWNKLPSGGYVSDAYIYTGYTGRYPGVPDCG